METSQFDKQTLTIIDIIRNVILNEINDLIYPPDTKPTDIFQQRAPYIKFIPIISCIEFLGACYDELPFEATRFDKQDIVEKRFNLALKQLFDAKKYGAFIKADHRFYFYKYLRCAMIHQLRPGPGILLTTRMESIEDKNQHVKEDDRGNLILVLEDFYDDLKKAASKIIWKFENKKLTNKKGSQAFIRILDYKKC